MNVHSIIQLLKAVRFKEKGTKGWTLFKSSVGELKLELTIDQRV